MGFDAVRDARLAEWMRAAQRGNEVAYSRLLDEIGSLLSRIMLNRRADLTREDVEDVVQDILLSLHEVRETYDPGRPVLPWVMAIARNRIADAGRRSRRMPGIRIDLDDLRETFFEPEANDRLEAVGDSATLRRAISDLPHRQREAVELLKLRECSLREAAALTGQSVASLKTAVHRALRTLRVALKAER